MNPAPPLADHIRVFAEEEDTKKRKNRLAQRKHRQSKRANSGLCEHAELCDVTGKDRTGIAMRHVAASEMPSAFSEPSIDVGSDSFTNVAKSASAPWEHTIETTPQLTFAEQASVDPMEISLHGGPPGSRSSFGHTSRPTLTTSDISLKQYRTELSTPNKRCEDEGVGFSHDSAYSSMMDDIWPTSQQELNNGQQQQQQQNHQHPPQHHQHHQHQMLQLAGQETQFPAQRQSSDLASTSVMDTKQHQQHSFTTASRHGRRGSHLSYQADSDLSSDMSDDASSTGAAVPTGPASSSKSNSNKPSDVHRRFEQVMWVVQQAGFSSIDAMATQYYTSNFDEDSVVHGAQARSRSHLLPNVLAAVHANVAGWSPHESQRYRQQVLGAAEDVLVGEVISAKKLGLEMDLNPGAGSSSSGSGRKQHHHPTLRHFSPPGNSKQGFSTQVRTSKRPSAQTAVQAMWEAIAEMESWPDARRKKKTIKDAMPDVWSLLVELARNANLSHPRASSAVFAFLVLLADEEATNGAATFSPHHSKT